MCFGAGWLEGFLIWLVWVVLAIAILGAILKLVLPRLAIGADIVQLLATIIWWVIFAIIAIVCIKLAFDVFYCIGSSYPRMR